ncbi:MAG: DUF2339 domain-containing protein [Synergistaceae bacterium]|jgi:uncharacterized membrane protein|nr:DUF2339 domain-containing protein [Synergistaceae bacterium]
MLGLIALGLLWLFIAPFVLLGYIGGLEKNLAQLLREELHQMEQRLKQYVEEAQKCAGATENATENEKPLVGEGKTLPDRPLPEALQAYEIPRASEIPQASEVPQASEIPRAAEVLVIPVSEEAPVEEPAGVMEISEVAEIAKEPDFAASGPEAAEKPEEEPAPYLQEYRYESLAVEEPQPQRPGPLEQAARRFFSWLLEEGNIWVCAGVLLFFVGFGLLFSYAVQIGVLTLEMRLAAAAVTGIVMAGFGFRIRERRRVYALILQGGGVGVLYLVILGATKFNALSTGLPVLSPAPAVVAMLVLSVFTVLLALLQDYQPLALFAVLGGFVAPILVSTGSRNHMALFSIYSLLNLEILALTVKRDWRLLNRLGFLFTLGVGTAWGLRDWRPELFGSVEPFLLAFFVTWTLTALCTGRRRGTPESGERRPDLLLAVSVPFSFFFLQMQVVGHLKYGMALTSLGLGLTHLLVGALLRREGRERENARILPHLHMGLCLLFSNFVVPYAFESSLSFAIWAAEGAFLIVMAYRWGSCKLLLGGVVFHLGAIGLYIPVLGRLNWSEPLSPIFVSGLLFAASHWVSGFFASRFRPSFGGPLEDEWERWLQAIFERGGEMAYSALSWAFVVLGSLWWWATVCDQVPRLGLPWLSVFSVVCVTALVACLASERFGWKSTRFLLTGPLVLGALQAVNNLLRQVVPPAGFPFRDILSPSTAALDAVVYLGSVGTSLYLLRRTAATLFSKAVFLVALLIGLSLFNRTMFQAGLRFGLDHARLFSALPLLAALFCLSRSLRFEETMSAWRQPLVAFGGVALLFRALPFLTSFSGKGSAFYGVFIPLLNPLELWQAVVMLSFALWIGLAVPERTEERRSPGVRWELAALFFVWINQVAARGTWWYLAATPFYSLWDVVRTSHFQAVAAILWGVLGLGAIFLGKKTRNRALWRTGAELLAADMLKLLLVDLNRAATLTRILAFLVLGGLFLLIGWAAPLPPMGDEKNDAAEPEEGGLTS